jgi:threonine/homoserine/homoserine lactone efflux protein
VAEPVHPAASHDPPSFISAPGETDVLMVVMGLTLALVVAMVVLLFFWLSALPQRLVQNLRKYRSPQDQSAHDKNRPADGG